MVTDQEDVFDKTTRRYWVSSQAVGMAGAIFGIEGDRFVFVRVPGSEVDGKAAAEVAAASDKSLRVPQSAVREIVAAPWRRTLVFAFEGRKHTWYAEDQGQRDQVVSALELALDQRFIVRRHQQPLISILAQTLPWLLAIGLVCAALVLAAESPEAALGTGRNLKRTAIVSCARAFGKGPIIAVGVLFALPFLASAAREVRRRGDVVRFVRAATS